MKPETYSKAQSPEAGVSPLTKQSSPAVKRKPSPFMEAAGMVMTVGLGVLRIVGKGIKGSVRLLMTQRR
jgi:hypothetical protein